jgi:hypothetical protein
MAGAVVSAESVRSRLDALKARREHVAERLHTTPSETPWWDIDLRLLLTAVEMADELLPEHERQCYEVKRRIMSYRSPGEPCGVCRWCKYSMARSALEMAP